jgi:shikimate kinase
LGDLAAGDKYATDNTKIRLLRRSKKLDQRYALIIINKLINEN